MNKSIEAVNNAIDTVTFAMVDVENLGCHPLLTDAVVLLSDAKRKLNEFKQGEAK